VDWTSCYLPFKAGRIRDKILHMPDSTGPYNRMEQMTGSPPA
jgi:hypothetical protein